MLWSCKVILMPYCLVVPNHLVSDKMDTCMKCIFKALLNETRLSQNKKKKKKKKKKIISEPNYSYQMYLLSEPSERGGIELIPVTCT